MSSTFQEKQFRFNDCSKTTWVDAILETMRFTINKINIKSKEQENDVFNIFNLFRIEIIKTSNDPRI